MASTAQRVFVNNVDSYIGNALCLGLHDAVRSGASRLVGTLKGGENIMVPPNVKRIFPRVVPTQLLKSLVQCAVLIYDMHEADLEELEFVIQALQNGDFDKPVTIILISSVATWALTKVDREPVPEPEKPPTPPPAEGEGAEGEEAPAAEAPAADGEGDDLEEEKEEEKRSSIKEEKPKKPVTIPVLLGEDGFEARRPSAKYLGWHTLEQRLLALNRKDNVSAFVVAAGVLYGCGELVLHDAFASALLYGGSTHRTIGPGNNYIPTAHVLDVVALVRHLSQAALEGREVGPSRYLLAVDRVPCTQRQIFEGIVGALGDPKRAPPGMAPPGTPADSKLPDGRLRAKDGYELQAKDGYELPLQAIEFEQALGVENADLFACFDLRLLPTERMQAEGFYTYSGCFAEDVGQVVAEFAEWRDVSPINLAVTGPPCVGKTALAKSLSQAFNVEYIGVAELLEHLVAQEPPNELLAELAEATGVDIEALAAMEKEEKAAAVEKMRGPRDASHLSADLLARIVQTVGLGTNGCKHKGFVLDGFPRSAEEAKLLFMEPPAPEEDEEGEPGEPTLRATAPLLAVVLEPPEDEAYLATVAEIPEESRVENHTDEAGFQRRLTRYRGEAALADTFYDEALPSRRDPSGQPAPGTVLRIPVEGKAASDVFAAAAEALRAKPLPFNYISHTEIAAAAEEISPETVMEADVVDEDAQQALREKEEREQWEMLMAKERVLLIKQSVALRAYLGEVVVPVVIDALMEICHLQPADPVDYLAEYLYHAVTAKEELGKIPPHWNDLEWGPPPDSEAEA
jgi:adenylate kinase